jgi:vacuolar-type H+-ATPase subunit C/Vma6
MWLFRPHGFYSITRSRTEPDKTQVRARTRCYLENLQTLTSNAAPILKTLNADYRWRIIISPGESERLVTLLTRDIDYPNFKASVAMRPDQKHREHDYHRIWELHHRWQSDADNGSAVSAPVPRPR